MYATTDGFTGCFGGWDTHGTGMNFLVHNLCRLPDSDGTWMICQGGMGAVTQALKEAAIKSGVEIRTDAEVVEIVLNQSVCRGVVLKDQSEIRADTVVCNTDPFKMRALVGEEKLPSTYNEKLNEFARLGGTSFKLNMAASSLPVFRCLPQDLGQYRTTTHLLPTEDNVLAVIDRSFKQASDGFLPDRPLIEWYFHTTVDQSLRDDKGNHSMALFVQWAPTRPKDMTWEEAEPIFVKRLLSILDEYAPGTSNLIIDTLPLSPMGIEKRFGITGGHIFHVDHRFGFGERLPYRTPIAGLYACGAGCHPGGGVMGAPGYNAAQAVLKDRETALSIR
jgi:phytoene dehydrogenase-like protein